MSKNQNSEWSFEEPVEDGVYLNKFDHYDNDSDALLLHIRNRRAYLDGKEWIVLGGIWKRIGDLPKPTHQGDK